MSQIIYSWRCSPIVYPPKWLLPMFAFYGVSFARDDSGLERPSDAAYHAGPWPCGIPGCDALEWNWPLMAPVADYVHRSNGSPWGCAAPWTSGSGLGREDSAAYHAGPWDQRLFVYGSAGIDHLHHQDIWGLYDEPWGCGAWNKNMSGLEREDSIEYHAGPWEMCVLTWRSLARYQRACIYDNTPWGCADVEPWEF